MPNILSIGSLIFAPQDSATFSLTKSKKNGKRGSMTPRRGKSSNLLKNSTKYGPSNLMACNEPFSKYFYTDSLQESGQYFQRAIIVKNTSAVGLFKSLNPKMFFTIESGPISLKVLSEGFIDHLRIFCCSFPFTEVWYDEVDALASRSNSSRSGPFIYVAAVAK